MGETILGRVGGRGVCTSVSVCVCVCESLCVRPVHEDGSVSNQQV